MDQEKKRKLVVVSEPDDDSCAGAWMYLRAHQLKFADVDWLKVRSGFRATPEEIAGRVAIHIDTGMLYDEVRNFDHHQPDDPRVGDECATSLIYKSFAKELGEDQILGLIAQYVLCVDHGKSWEATQLVRDSQFSGLLRALAPLLLSLKYTRPWTERMQAGFSLLDGFYEGVRVELLMAAELRTKDWVRTPFGTVLFGTVERDHKELRAFARQHLGALKRPEDPVDVTIVGYKDNSVGITLLNRREDWKLNLGKVRELLVKKFPECADRVFLHQNGFVLYVRPTEDGNKSSVPTPDDLFDLAREVYNQTH